MTSAKKINNSPQYNLILTIRIIRLSFVKIDRNKFIKAGIDNIFRLSGTFFGGACVNRGPSNSLFSLLCFIKVAYF
jgi:hypothetical protein